MIKPLGERVVIEVAESDVKTASGIVLPDTAKEKPQKGTVVAVGAGKRDHKRSRRAGEAREPFAAHPVWGNIFAVVRVGCGHQVSVHAVSFHPFPQCFDA